jgi:hypothetical protein
MPDHDLIKIFISRLNRLGVRYIVTGAVACIIYGEPRLTHDLDLVIELNPEEVDRFATTFPIEEFYCPPPEVIQIEIARQQRGHFNLIHHNTGFKADIYLSGLDKLHQWALKNRTHVDFEGEALWLAPVEYVILRKLQYHREGRSEKHLRDISGILEISPSQIDFKTLKDKIKKMGLEEEWEKISKGLS